MAQVKEYKDKSDEHRIRMIASNGKIVDATTEGYKNKKDAISNRVNASIAYISHYRDELTENDVMELEEIINSLKYV